MAEAGKGLDTRLIAAIVVALLIGLALGAFMFRGGEEQAAAGEAQTREQAGETAETTAGGGEQATGGGQAATGQQAEAQTGGGTEQTMEAGREQAEGEMAPEQPPVEEVAKAVNLRVNVGRAAGLGLALQGYTSIAVIAQDNLLCSVLGSSLASAYEAQTGRDVALYTVRPGVNEAVVAGEIVGRGLETVVLAYGGGAPADIVASGFANMTRALMEAGFNGTIVVHAAALVAKALDAALGDEALCSYLRGVEVVAYAPKPDEGKLYYYKIKVGDDCKYTMEKAGEYPIPPAKLPPAETLTQGAPVRLKVGAAAGMALYEMNFTSPVILAQRNGLCTTIAAATAVSYNSLASKLPGMVYLDPGVNEEQAVALALESKPDIIVLQFGGETPGADARQALEATLAALRDAGYQGALMIHAALYASKVFQATVPGYCDYLQQVDLYLYLPDAEAGQLKVFKVGLQDCGVQLEGPVYTVDLP